MKVLHPMEENLMQSVRDAQALNPIISVNSMLKVLEEKYHRGFSWYYVKKLMMKVSKRARMELDVMKIEDRMAQTRETYRLMREQLLRIVYWKPEDSMTRGIKPPFYTEIITAAEKVVVLDLAIMQAEINNGFYRKPLEERVREMKYEPLPADVRKVILDAWERSGILPPGTAEQMVPLKIDAATQNTTA